jgi:Tfp pilus assembly PilM family ATPase
VVGVHTETMAMVRAFDHLCKRDADANITTLLVDMGWGGTRMAVTHGKQLTFARYVPIGGKHFDQLIASTVHCDVPSARAHRLSLQSKFDVLAKQAEEQLIESALTANAEATVAAGARGAKTFVNEPAQSPAPSAVVLDRRIGAVPTELSHGVPHSQTAKPQVNVDMSELLDTISDELSMSLRYHQSLFKGRAIDRTVFIGGEARQTWLCQHIVKNIRTPAQLGDPLARYHAQGVSETPGLTLGQPQPGWAVACGLCNAPTDL